MCIFSIGLISCGNKTDVEVDNTNKEPVVEDNVDKNEDVENSNTYSKNCFTVVTSINPSLANANEFKEKYFPAEKFNEKEIKPLGPNSKAYKYTDKENSNGYIEFEYNAENDNILRVIYNTKDGKQIGYEETRDTKFVIY